MSQSFVVESKDSVRPNANRARYRFDWESIGSSTLVGWKNKPGPHFSESHDSLYLSMVLEGQDHHVTAPVVLQKNRALAHPDERYVVESVETAIEYATRVENLAIFIDQVSRTSFPEQML